MDTVICKMIVRNLKTRVKQGCPHLAHPHHHAFGNGNGATEAGIRFDDPDVGIAWPDDIELLYSERDRDAPLLADVADSLPFRYDG